MWVNRRLFDMIVEDNKRLQDALVMERGLKVGQTNAATELRTQKTKDDLTIDWLRHRVNALEKQNAMLLNKAAGIVVPVPEIVPTRPGSIAGMPADFPTMPSFEDPGDAEAERLGVQHDDAGILVYTR